MGEVVVAGPRDNYRHDRRFQRWRLALIVLAMVGLFTFDILVPQVIVLPLVAVPVLLASLWFSPPVVGLLAVLNVVIAVISGLVNDYFAAVNGVLWMSAMVVVGVVAVGVALTRTRLEARQSETAARLQAALDAEFDPHVILEAVRDPSGRIVDFIYTDANPAACSYNRLKHEDLIGKRLLELLPGHLASGLIGTYAKVVETGEPMVLNDYVYEQELRGGEERRYDVRGVKIGESISYTWRDVTERHAIAQQIAESEERYRLLAENSSDVVLRFRDHIVIWVSPSLVQALGWKPEDWVGHALAEFMSPFDEPTIADSMRIMDAGRPALFRGRFTDSSGTWHWVEAHAQVFRDAGGRPDGYLSSFRVIDKEVEAEAVLHRQATYDDLTGAVKRDQALKQLLEIGQHPRTPGRETAVLFVDVDDFKTVNDTYGHAAGDAVLQSMADSIRACVRAGDTLARMGGDEFLVILTGLHSLDEGTAIAEKIRTECAEPITLREGTITETVSIGVTLVDAYETGDDLVARADRGMYAAKAAGRNRVVTVPRPQHVLAEG